MKRIFGLVSVLLVLGLVGCAQIDFNKTVEVSLAPYEPYIHATNYPAAGKIKVVVLQTSPATEAYLAGSMQSWDPANAWDLKTTSHTGDINVGYNGFKLSSKKGPWDSDFNPNSLKVGNWALVGLAVKNDDNEVKANPADLAGYNRSIVVLDFKNKVVVWVATNF